MERQRETDRQKQTETETTDRARTCTVLEIGGKDFTGKKGEGALHGDGNILYLTLDNCLISSVQSLSRVRLFVTP